MESFKMIFYLRMHCFLALTLSVVFFPCEGNSEACTLSFGELGEGNPRAFFQQVMPGTATLGGVGFQLTEQMLRVRAGSEKTLHFPATTAESIHFLHFTENAGDRLGSYTLLYEDGNREEIPLQHGISIQDWWLTGPLPFAAEAFTDTLGGIHTGKSVSFWRFSVRNPRPDVPLCGITATVIDPTVTLNILAVTLDHDRSERIAGIPVWVPGMDEESFILALLEQPEKTGEEAKFCARLAQTGSRKCIPLLASYLLDEETSQGARIALEALPYEEARNALRSGLAKSKGAVKAGILESLGKSGQKTDLPLLLSALDDKDPSVVRAAVLALGKFGGPPALRSLWHTADKASEQCLPLVQEALLACTDTLPASGRKEAFRSYRQYLSRWSDSPGAAAAWKGMLLTGGRNSADLLFQALMSDSDASWQGALSALPHMNSKKAVRRAGKALDQLQDSRRCALIAVLGQGKNMSALPFVLPWIEAEDQQTALDALDALIQLDSSDAVPALIQRAVRKDGAIAEAALQALASLRASGTAAALVRYLDHADPAVTETVAKVLELRREDSVAPELRRLVHHRTAKVRIAAAGALAAVGNASDAALLADVWHQSDSPEDAAACFSALQKLVARLGSDETYIQTLAACHARSNTPQRCALFSLFGTVGAPQLLALLGDAAATGTPEEKEAALKALSRTRNPDALPLLQALLKSGISDTMRLPLIRNLAALSQADEMNDAARTALLRECLDGAKNLQEKRILLSALNRCSSPDALVLAEAWFHREGTEAEGAVAWGTIALALLDTNRTEISQAFPALFAEAQAAGLSANALEPLYRVRKILNAEAVPGKSLRFKEICIDTAFRSEGIAIADINRDGLPDVVVGDYWYAAPGWTAHEIRPPGTYDALTEYSRAFAVFAEDVNRDGWADVIVVGFPGAPVYWYRNPGKTEGHWQEYLIAVEACGETVLYEDITGDGKRELIFAMNKRITWLTPGQDVTAPWIAYPFTHQLEQFALFGHGLGIGDVNGDGRTDVLSTVCWWEGPTETTRPDWTPYPADLGPDCAHMLVYDANNDGLMDIITSSAHDYGIWWFEQQPSGQAPPSFIRHEIDRSISATHALIQADLNNDGLADLITGKRFYAHGKEDPGALEPALLCWYELQRDMQGNPSWTRHVIHEDSGVGTQFEVCDVDGDGLDDIAVSSKKGVRIFLQRRDSSS